MLKNLLIAAAIVSISPAFVSAEQIFFAFGQGADATDTSTATTADGSGSVFIFSDADFAFDAADLTFTTTDPSVIQFTTREATNPEFITIGGTRFDSAEFPLMGSIPQTSTGGRLLLINVQENGVNPPVSRLFDPDFMESVTLNGVDGAVLLAQLDFDIVGPGTTDIEFSLGPNGAIELVTGGERILTPTFGSASLTVTAEPIPEPSSVALLMLGSIGLVARRRRA